MSRKSLVISLALLGLAPARADGQCLNPIELQAEAVVRTAVGLRDTLRRCARQGESRQALAAWNAFADEFAENISRAVADRSAAIKRLFPANANAERDRNRLLVSTYGQQRLSPAHCASTAATMESVTAGGWARFMYFVEIEQRAVRQNTGRCD